MPRDSEVDIGTSERIVIYEKMKGERNEKNESLVKVQKIKEIGPRGKFTMKREKTNKKSVSRVI